MISDNVVFHICMPGHTIEALIKKENRYDISQEEMKKLLEKFNELNSAVVPRVGQRLVIPILQRHEDVLK